MNLSRAHYIQLYQFHSCSARGCRARPGSSWLALPGPSDPDRQHGGSDGPDASAYLPPHRQQSRNSRPFRSKILVLCWTECRVAMQLTARRGGCRPCKEERASNSLFHRALRRLEFPRQTDGRGSCPLGPAAPRPAPCPGPCPRRRPAGGRRAAAPPRHRTALIDVGGGRSRNR